MRTVDCRIYQESCGVHARVEVIVKGRYVGSLRMTLDEADAFKTNEEFIVQRTPDGSYKRAAEAEAQKATAKEASPDEVRTWAREHGFAVADRGRISRAARKAYEKAHS